MTDRVELERRIADLRARLPRHSVPTALLLELEELEEELERRMGERELGRKLAVADGEQRAESRELRAED